MGFVQWIELTTFSTVTSGSSSLCMSRYACNSRRLVAGPPIGYSRGAASFSILSNDAKLGSSTMVAPPSVSAATA
eukprot:7275012-Prymnesium_polylepis.1